MRNFSILLFVTLLFLSFSVFGQGGNKNSDPSGKIAWTKNGSRFMTFKPGVDLSSKSAFTTYHSDFGLGNNDEMKLIKTDADKSGNKHYRFQQFYKGYPVEGAVFLLHEKNGKVINGNGTIVKGLNLSGNVSISSSEALQKAMNEVPSEKYIWQDNESELMLKEMKGDRNATYYPVPQLVYFDKKFSQNPASYKLAYKIEIYSLKPLARKYIYIDAVTGQVIHTINMIQTTDVPATGATKYNGNQQIVVDSVSVSSYRLRETGRGNGIITRSTQNSENYGTAIDITDDTTVTFNSDDVAISAHWGAEMTYDYFWNTFARNSYDNNGAALLSYVHYSDNYANAFWDGSKMTYGDGNSTYSPFTTIDICGHEITHAVTEHTANLVYQDESGALNEAFSDIFGTCIEFYGDLSPNWEMGEDIGDPIRSMSNPNQYQNPDTYHGTYWDYDPNNMDNGGVHTNSGVANFWFYLLCVGGNGTNDNGDAYSVTALGRNVAEYIAYNTLAYYLTSTSEYYDAYQASIAFAEAEYGPCSNEVNQVANAWAAVGVGFPYDPQEVYVLNVLSPATDCDLQSETVSLRLFYNGCDTMLQANDTISIAYKFDNGSVVNENYILASNWQGGDSLVVSFSAPVDASALGAHTLNCWVKYGPGTTNFTDSIMNYTFYTLQQQNVNMGMIKVANPVSECDLTSAEHITVKFGFYGCDFLPSGTIVDLSYKVNNGDTITEPYTVSADMYPTDTITYTFSTVFDGSTDGTYSIDAWTAYDQDIFNTNDHAPAYSIKNIAGLGVDTLGFEETNALDYVLIRTTPYSNASIKSQAHAPGSTRGFLMTGGNAMSYIDMLEMPSGFNTWQINEFLSAKAIFCVDATNWNTAYMKFDLKQTHGGNLYSQYIGGNPEDYRIASNLRLLANSSQIGGTYNPTTPSSDAFVRHLIDLNTYAGSEFTLTIETRNIAKDTVVLLPVTLDNAYIDNVHFFPGPVAVEDSLGVNIQWAAVAHVLDNDNNNGVATLKTKIINQPSNGTASVNTDNTISYTPNTGFTGLDSVRYSCCYTTDTTICDEAILLLWVYDGMSVDENSNDLYFAVYPNPFNSAFTLECMSQGQSNAEITITDILGQVVSASRNDLHDGLNRFSFDMEGQPDGIYLVQIRSAEGTKVMKMTKK